MSLAVRHRHQWAWLVAEDDERYYGCRGCRLPQDPVRSARGRSAGRLGKDQERRIERLYGPVKVGEHGDATDHLGSTFKWQSRATRGAWPHWLEAVGPVTWVPGEPAWITGPIEAMLPLAPHLAPLLIRSRVVNGVGTFDRIIVRTIDWAMLHGLPHDVLTMPYLVMSGLWFLDHHGRDEPRPRDDP